jgi:nucleotide-binding universal stress UspA family protein
MIKRLLVPIDGSEYAKVGARYAVALAQRHAAQVVGVFVIDVKLLEGPFLRDLSASLGTAPYVNYQGNIARILEERGQAALDALRAACEAAGVACETRLSTGLVARTIVDEGDLCDLIVLGRGGEHQAWLEGLVGSTTEAVARQSRRPVLVTGVDTPGTRKVLAAYDGSGHARQALRVAADLAQEWGLGLDLLVVAEEETANRLLDEARGYLQSHALSVEYVLLSGEPAEVIVQQARTREADVIVMGAYGHAKVLEWVIGSTTTYVLNHAPCPVLLAR